MEEGVAVLAEGAEGDDGRAQPGPGPQAIVSSHNPHINRDNCAIKYYEF